EAGVGSVMLSYSRWNGSRMHGDRRLVTGLLKEKLGFRGIVVSDWAAVDQLDKDYKAAVRSAINAGLDMVMIPYGPGREGKNTYAEFIRILKELVASGEVDGARIDDAVGRILRIKAEMGL